MSQGACGFQRALSSQYGKGSTLPGTFVDKLVASPYYRGFYLQLHIGVKGTVRPAHYFVLENDTTHLSLGDLRDLTHSLNYPYVRSLVGVSYTSPTYYADRLCERGRLYLQKFFVTNVDEDLYKDVNNFKNEQSDLKKADRDKKYGPGRRKMSDKGRRKAKDDSKAVTLAV
ncbi:Piwi-domain-containing protein [Corynespora cassiicola Philippines]|uniref:Piwi-domain-containing protein n=1 Tax=Corynespora cassiicola Philippines TaxID=1448308 RepID=A0A2T2NM28_CORCC|nr:Piwi-domain-containing protein [Corynespora cassiicola Philippines]